MELKKMSDTELARMMVNYILRVDHLCNLIANYLDMRGNSAVSADQIRNEYSQLKQELREDGNYLGLVSNQKGSLLYMSAVKPSIREAAACGFTVPVNRTINQQMYSAVDTARYKLTKIKTFEEWEELM